MSSSEASPTDGFAAAEVAHHFADARTQLHAARLGMWTFLSTEVLLFAGLFALYAYGRVHFPAAFVEGSRQLDVRLGTLNTALLLTSSLFVALALHATRRGRRRPATALLLAATALGIAFLGVKAVEYAAELGHGAYPGRRFALEGFAAAGGAVFFSVYFATTGLHAIHVTAGIGVLVWLAAAVGTGRVHERRDAPLELGGLYWHLVDVIWIFLYPLLYLVG